jgi:serine/threonine protein kinase
VLPVSVATDAGRLARFQRESEVLAALNHPNIAHIFGLEKSGGTIALAEVLDVSRETVNATRRSRRCLLRHLRG